MFSLHLVLLLGYLHLLLTPYLRRGPRFPGFPVLAQFLLVLVGFSSTFFLLYTLPYLTHFSILQNSGWKGVWGLEAGVLEA